MWEACACYKQAYIFVEYGLGSKILKAVKKERNLTATIFYGRGIMKNFWLQLFELSEARREVIILTGNQAAIDGFLHRLNGTLHFEKPNHGIACTIELKDIVVGGCLKDIVDDGEIMTVTRENEAPTEEINVEGKEVGMHQAIFIIVEKGRAEDAVEAAQDAGARGGTIINARGAGREECCTLFNMAVEPEREVLLIIAEKERTQGIVEGVKKCFQQGGKRSDGNEPCEPFLIFVQDVAETYGLYSSK